MHHRWIEVNNSALMHIAMGAPLAQILTRIVNWIEEQNGEILGAIFLLNEDGTYLSVGAGPSLDHHYIRAIERIVTNVGVWSRKLSTKSMEQVAAENIEANKYWFDFCNLALQYGLYIAATTPILSSTNSVLGMFVSYSRQSNQVDDQHLQAIAAVTAMLSIAIERNADKAKIEKIENILCESDARMALAVEESGIGIWDRNIPNGEIHYSARWKAILGYTDSEIGNRIEDSYRRVHPDDLAYVQATIQTHFDLRSESYAVEHRLRCKNGSYKWVLSRGRVVSRDADGKPLRMIGTTTDITAIRQLSEKLQQSVDLITNLTNAVPGMVFQYQASPDGSAAFSYVSEGIKDIYELSPEQAIDNVSLIHQIIHPDDFTNYIVSFKASAANLTPWHLEYRVVLPRQGLRWLQGDARPRRSSDGGTLWHGFITDITERKHARLLLEQTENQLLQSEKLAAIGQLAAGVAHEINNPIGFVSSNLAQLGDYISELFSLIAEYECGDVQLPAELQASISATKNRIDIGYIKEDIPQLLDQSKDGIDRVQKIVRSLRDFSRVDNAHEQHAFDIHVGIESTLNIIRNELKHTTIHKDFDHALPEIECVGSQINQIILNLLVNAAHSIANAGDIWIKTGCDSKQIFIEITDNGVGIPPEIQARIFEPFFTTKPIGKGTGLGLSVSYGIVQKHGGKIDVKSELQRGSTFTIWLPIKCSSQNHD